MYGGEASVEGHKRFIDAARKSGELVECPCCLGTYKAYRRPLRLGLGLGAAAHC